MVKRLFVFSAVFVLLCGLTLHAVGVNTSNQPLRIIAPLIYESRIQPIASSYRAQTGNEIEIEYIEDTKEYLTRMNTEILAGEGPDLFVAVDLPYWEYARKGLLCDIGKMIEDDPDLDIADFHENIVDPLRDENGNLFVMPCSYSFYWTSINIPLLQKYGVAIPDQWTMETLFETLRSFTQNTKGSADIYSFWGGPQYYKKTIVTEAMLHIDFEASKSYIQNMDQELLRLADKSSDISIAPFNTLDGKGFAVTVMHIEFPNSFQYPGFAWRMYENPDFAYINYPYSYESGKAVYELQNAFCINKNGNIEEAWRFVKAALSENLQNNNIMAIANPILKSATDYRFARNRDFLVRMEELIEKGEDYKPWLYTDIPPDQIPIAAEQYLETYKKLLGELGTPRLGDPALEESIGNILTSDPDGNIDPVSAKAEIARIVDVYLQEMGGDVQRGYSIIYIAAGLVAVGAISVILFRAAKRRKGSKA